MLSGNPPCLEPGISYSVGDGAFVSAPQPLVERPVQNAKIEAVGKPQKTPQMRAESQFRRGIQVVERSQSAKPENGHLRILHKRSIQIAPVRSQNVHRLALAFLVLI